MYEYIQVTHNQKNVVAGMTDSAYIRRCYRIGLDMCITRTTLQSYIVKLSFRSYQENSPSPLYSHLPNPRSQPYWGPVGRVGCWSRGFDWVGGAGKGTVRAVIGPTSRLPLCFITPPIPPSLPSPLTPTHQK